MKFLWVLGCVLAALDMAGIALGREKSEVFSPEYVGLAWLPAIGWSIAAVKAAVLDESWF